MLPALSSYGGLGGLGILVYFIRNATVMTYSASTVIAFRAK